MGNVVLLDGAVGTTLWSIAESHGVAKDPVWKYNIEHPELVTEHTRLFAEAGSRIILANTFGANAQNVKRSSKYTVNDVVTAAVELGRDALKDSDARLFLALGPLSQLMEPYGDLEEDEVAEIYDEMLAAAMKKGVDGVMIQTFMDLEMMKVAARTAKNYGVPVFCTMTFEKVGKTLMGNSVDDIINELEPIGIDAIGMNCSLGPELALPIIRSFVGKTNLPLIFKPNAGLPKTDAEGKTIAEYGPEDFVREVAPALDFVNYIGGCCNTDSSYIRKLKEIM